MFENEIRFVDDKGNELDEEDVGGECYQKSISHICVDFPVIIGLEYGLYAPVDSIVQYTVEHGTKTTTSVMLTDGCSYQYTGNLNDVLKSSKYIYQVLPVNRNLYARFENPDGKRLLKLDFLALCGDGKIYGLI